MQIFDISPTISEDSLVWPGDIGLKREVLRENSAGVVERSVGISTTLHIGAHVDAPSHLSPDGCSIDQVDLADFIGPAIVVTVTNKRLVGKEDCIKAVHCGHTRILFRTLSQLSTLKLDDEFSAISPEAIAFMGRNGVRLVGIDTASVDPLDSTDFAAHAELFKWDMRNIENLDLRNVEDGEYELIALPLKIRGVDGSPLRAILRR